LHKCGIIGYFFNSQGLPNKQSDLFQFIDENNPDFVAICETWFTADDFSESFIPSGYVIIRGDRSQFYPGVIRGGVAIIAKETLSPTVLIPAVERKCEFICITISAKSFGKLAIAVCYRPSNSNYIETFGISEDEVLRNICDCFGIIDGINGIITGDFNFPNLLWPDVSATSALEVAFVDALSENLLTQTVDFPTRRGNILDLVLSNCAERVHASPVPGFAGSDHDVTVKLKIDAPYSPDTTDHEVRVYSKADWGSIRRHFDSIDWVTELNGLSSVDAWNFFMRSYNFAVENYIPLLKPKKKSFPWLTTPSVKKLTRDKSRLWRYYKKFPLNVNFVEYQRVASRLSLEIRLARIEYERRLAANIDKNPKAFFKYTRNFVKPRSKITCIERPDGSLLENAPDIAEFINDHFVSVFTNEPPGPVPAPRTGWCPASIGDINFSAMDVQKKLLSLNPQKSAGPDEIKSLILRRCAYQLCTPLYIIFRKAIDSGIIPSDWKCANITPIPKVAASKKVNDLRPISLTSIPAKIIESLIWEKVIPFLIENNRIGKHQHGALKHRSTVTSLLDSLNRWTEAFDEPSVPGIDVLYLDFQKAFDSVPLRRLLSKLEHAGIRDRLLSFFRAFLLARKQRVVLNGHVSNWKDVVSGIPQGTLSGPFSFLVFIDDLPGSIDNHTTLFVDDVKIDRVIHSRLDCISLQNSLDCLQEWCDDFLLTPKPSKCAVLRIRPKLDYTYRLRGTPLPVVSKVKDLGVWISSDLKSNCHIDYIEAKANRCIGLIKRCVLSRSVDVILALFKGLVRPLLEYASSAWSPVYTGLIERLERVQRRCLRLARDIDSARTSKLWERRETIDLINCFKIIAGASNLKRDEFFRFPTRQLRGHERKLAVQHRRTNIRGHFFCNRVVKNWNNLPACVTSSNCVNSFKANLRALRSKPSQLG
jgi:hypothetical protein